MAQNDLINTITTTIIIETLIILLVTVVLLRFVRFVIPRIADRFSNRRRLSILFIMPILRLIIIFTMVGLLIRLYLVTTQQNLFAILGALAIAVGFAFKDYLSNLIAGLIIMYEMPFRPGDWIEVNEVYGEVRSIGLRVLELWTADDTIVKVPQSTFWNSMIFNSSSGDRTLQVSIDFFVDPSNDMAHIKSLLLDATKTSAFHQFSKPTNILIQEFPGYTRFKIRTYPIDSRHQFKYKSDVTLRAKELFELHKVKMVMLPVLR